MNERFPAAAWPVPCRRLRGAVPPWALRAVCLATLSAAALPVAAQPSATGGMLGEVRVDATAERETATSPVVGYRAQRAARPTTPM